MPEPPLIIRAGRVIRPREVERILLSHPAVGEAAVVGIPDPFWNETVAAAIRLSAPPHTALSSAWLSSFAADLTRFCRARLAVYKIPARWLLAGALPRTPAGEICRATLTARLAVMPGRNASRPATADLRIPQQVRRSWALEDPD